MGKAKVRDFIYLDSDRLRSIISQLEGGLVHEEVYGTSNTADIDGKIEGSLAGLIKGTGGANYLWKRDASETRTLHDYIYTRTEEKLISEHNLLEIPGAITEKDIESSFRPATLKETSFVLITGTVTLNDFTRMQKLIEKFNDLGKFISYCSTSSLSNDISTKQKNKIQRQQTQSMQIDKKLQDGLKLFIDTFYEGRLVIQLVPFAKHSAFSFVGNLDPNYLREDVGTVIYKYGTAPRKPWTVFAQIAAMPESKVKVENGEEETGIEQKNDSEIETAFRRMFDAVREIEKVLEPISYPEIAITPIAVYRE